MRIGIDIRCLQTPSKTRGIGAFTHNLVTNILALDKNNEYLLFAFKDIPLNFDLPKDILRFLPHPGAFYHLGWIKESIFLPKFLKKYNLDIFHFTSPFETGIGFDLRRKTKFKKIANIYDLTPFYFQKQHFPAGWKNKYLNFFYMHILKTTPYSDKIIAISKNTARDLSKELAVPEEKIAVTYCGIDKKIFLQKNADISKSIKEKYNLPAEFLLYVGAITPTKNIKFLLNVIRKIKLPLVIAGHRTKKETAYLVESLTGLDDLVQFIDFVPEVDLPYLYGAAKIFVFPSLYEGFGMPAAEAMAAGTPVISSNTSSMPEVIQDAGVLINPADEKAWEETISALWKNGALREELSKKGIKQASRFSWIEAARTTIKVYESLGSNLE